MTVDAEGLACKLSGTSGAKDTFQSCGSRLRPVTCARSVPHISKPRAKTDAFGEFRTHKSVTHRSSPCNAPSSAQYHASLCCEGKKSRNFPSTPRRMV